jgi:hypothetical protein
MLHNILFEGRIVTNDDEISSLAEHAIASRTGKDSYDYIDPSSGVTLLPRAGSDTSLKHSRAHFYHPAELHEQNIGHEKRKVLKTLEAMLASSGDFSDFHTGILSFQDEESREYNIDFNYGFQALLARKSDGKTYAILALNRVPNSSDFLKLIKSLNHHDMQTRLLLDKEGKLVVDEPIYLAAVQLRNEHMYRPNKESGHPSAAIMLGDWQAKHLSQIFREFVYLEGNKIDAVNLKKFSHDCSYSHNRYRFKNQAAAEESDFCQKAVSRYGLLERFTLEPYEVRKDSLAEKIGSHPRLHLANVVPAMQLGLF